MKAGRVMYSGRIMDVMGHFESAGVKVDRKANPADFVVDLTQYADEVNPYFITDGPDMDDTIRTEDEPSKEVAIASNIDLPPSQHRDCLEVFYCNSPSCQEYV
ncbi:hypothetical protein SARC_14742 [Sphaeroforma arctica JP610]|uniref:Uncharacterized protein n=1 Tax=Sphaeroforma arctica JP610 TaxID=667725 RepID=A0A0L0F9B2_9EUKA|nr:hypothetical protein SARC_14742 [Sphaeroforma arctica JP610]KNC72698.1 hypothetical protein SARC_14742 [Sphaeroforma arctica JP610]|eukprot:XP_014146600.1 hypothetical protein SARC_14742 [Sphaeroforma arctica JP610]